MPAMSKFNSYMTDELGLSNSTIEAYTRDVKEFVKFAGQLDLTSEVVENFAKYLKKKKLQNATIRRKCMSVRCFYNNMVSLGLMSQVELDTIDPISVQKKEYNVPSNQDVEKLLGIIRSRSPKCRAINIHRDVSIVLILYHSGLRVSELCSLNLPNVNFSQKSIRVLGKGVKERIVPITAVCSQSISEYIKRERFSNESAVFVDGEGRRLTRRSISNMITCASNRAKIGHVTSHTLRRGCATYLMNCGVDLELVQKLLGHSDISTTERYLSVDKDKLRETHRLCHPFGNKNEI